jgi:HlyD family secretion protein
MARAQDPQVAIRRLNLVGLALLVLFFGVASAWAVTVQLAGAVTASGTIVVESAVKKVQHPTGGIVGQLLAMK